MQHEEIQAVIDGIVPAFKGYLGEIITPLLKRIEELESRPVAKDGRDGINPEEIELRLLEDGRTLEFSVERSIGGDDVLRYAQEITLPIAIYRGVWEEGEFTKGDLVTHEGGMWHAMTDTKTKPGTSPDWKLAVKRGAHG